MTLLNWILITLFAVLIVALFIIVVIVKRKAKDYEGILWALITAIMINIETITFYEII
ncbi:MAG: hypothetical protein ACLSCV_00125 [Acutalibacteraceae bacterium]